MIYVFLGVSIVLFVICLKIFTVMPKVSHVVFETREAISVMKSPEMSDEQKEATLQTAAVRMFGYFFSILLRVALSFGIPLGYVILGSALGFYTTEEAVATTSNWYFIIGSTLVMISAWDIVK